ncbi:MAG TPA: hypothetical protein VM621_05650 [Luteibacter sp.]|uniref:hypothetical protein n=1 Tax=Luteibacter sp. TaxID=1886636 RepID=UPI002B62DF53|nr:hypothetical protein [Luteibacter sp.]HVI54521.1 hypothetical protein [Luteibacter sp.]
MNRKARAKYLIILCASVLTYSHIVTAQDSPQVVLSKPADPGLAERGVITLSITNPTDDRVAIVSFETPFATDGDRLANVEFQVSDSTNKDLPYRGRNVYFGPPDSSSFLMLEPHETVRKNVDIVKEYGIAEGGAYKITYVKNIRILRSSSVLRVASIKPGDEIPLEAIRSNTLTVWVNDARIKAQRATTHQQAEVDAAARSTCTASQTSTLSNDVSANKPNGRSRCDRVVWNTVCHWCWSLGERRVPVSDSTDKDLPYRGRNVYVGAPDLS